jgi:hypothetical protein
MIKSKRMKWSGHVARMGETRNAYMWESQKIRDNWEDQGVGRWTILLSILERWDRMD